MKLTRYNGHVPLFSQDMEGRERTLFGSTVQDDDINNQFTPEFLRGWGSVGSTEFPTLQDFNALAYTHNKLLSYLYQAGVPSYTQNEEYYIGSIVQYNKDIYICLIDNPTVLPTDTNAWRRVQESLTFVGEGPEVMKKGAFGIGYHVVVYSKHDILDIQQYNTGFSWFWAISAINRPENRNGYFYVNKTSDSYAVIEYVQDGGREFKNVLVDGAWSGWFYIYDQNNTRTDKNNVIHAGTSTPINTLNVSDMSQEVINNDLLTVTSGAVYRALQPKADSTYVNTELNKKANLTYVNTELGKKITGGDVVQTTGQSTVDVMSQKAYTDLTFGIGQSVVNTTANRSISIVYRNTLSKPIVVSAKLKGNRPYAYFKIDGLPFGYNHSPVENSTTGAIAIVPAGSSYELVATPGSLQQWVEIR